MDERDSGSEPDTPADKPEVDSGPSKRSPARKRFGWRPGVWLTTLSTVVAVATGMFTLRNQIFPNSGGGADASPLAYEYSVGPICRGLNRDQEGLRANDKLLAKRLRVAETPTAERNAVLDSWDETLDQSEYWLARFKSLAVPNSLRARERTTEGAWSQMVGTMQGFVQRLNAVTSPGALASAVGALPRSRTTISMDGVTLAAGLQYLGGGQCILDQPITIATVTLPGHRSKLLTPSVNPPTRPAGTPTVAPPVTPPTTTTIAPPVSPPTSTTTAPPTSPATTETSAAP